MAIAFIAKKLDIEKSNADRRLSKVKTAQLNRESANQQSNKKRDKPTTES